MICMSFRSLVDELMERAGVDIKPDDRITVATAIELTELEEEEIRNPRNIHHTNSELFGAQKILRRGVVDAIHDSLAKSLLGYRRAEIIDVEQTLLIEAIDNNYWTGDSDCWLARYAARTTRGFREKADQHFYRAVEKWVKHTSEDRGSQWAYRRARVADATFRMFEYWRRPEDLQLARELIEPLGNLPTGNPQQDSYIISMFRKITRCCSDHPQILDKFGSPGVPGIYSPTEC